MAERLKKGIAQSQLPPDTDAKLLASFFATVFRGMAVQARDGKSRKRLLEIGQVAMKAWPAAHKPNSSAGFALVPGVGVDIPITKTLAFRGGLDIQTVHASGGWFTGFRINTGVMFVTGAAK